MTEAQLFPDNMKILLMPSINGWLEDNRNSAAGLCMPSEILLTVSAQICEFVCVCVCVINHIDNPWVKRL